MDDLDVGRGGGVRHPQAGGQGLDGGVRVGQRLVHAMHVGFRHIARGTHAVHVDVDAVELAHESGQLGDVHAGAAVDFRGILSGHHRNSHGIQRNRKTRPRPGPKTGGDFLPGTTRKTHIGWWL